MKDNEKGSVVPDRPWCDGTCPNDNCYACKEEWEDEQEEIKNGIH